MRIHVAKKMRAVLEAVKQFQEEHPRLCIDIAPECEDTWGPNYAIVTFTLDDADGGEYFDIGRAIDDVHDIVKKTFGTRFHVQNYPHNRGPYKVGELYLIFHGNSHGEIEAYRQRPKEKS